MGATARDGRGREAPKDKNDLMRGRPGKTTAKGVDVNDGARLGGRVCARAWTAVDRDNRGSCRGRGQKGTTTAKDRDDNGDGDGWVRVGSAAGKEGQGWERQGRERLWAGTIGDDG